VARHTPMDRRVLAAQAEVAAADFAVLNEPAGDIPGCVNANCKADSLSGQDYHRVDPNNLSARIDQRSSGVARIKRRIGLDDIINEPACIGPKRAARGADDTGGYGALEPIRIAYRNGQLAHAKTLGIAQSHGTQLRSINPEHCQVGIRIVSHQVGIRPATIGQRDFESARAVDDMAVGQQEAVWGNDKTRSAALASTTTFSHLNVDHRRAYLIRSANYRL
jgi:hypothetical protein